jgi:hypothetical protein
MRSAMARSGALGWLLVACLLLVAFFGENLALVFAQRPAGVPASPERSFATGDALLSHSIELGDGRQQITLIDARTRSLAVYQVDPRTGAIALKSVRNVNWDLQMDEFNCGGNPSPKEIRSLLEQR